MDDFLLGVVDRFRAVNRALCSGHLTWPYPEGNCAGSSGRSPNRYLAVFATFGGTAIFQEMFQNLGLVASMNDMGTQSVVFTMLSHLPLGQILAVLFLILIFLFLATTVDSFSYVCAQVSTKEDQNPKMPSKPLRAVWAIAIAALAITMILVGKGQIQSLQLSSVVASIVIMVVMVLMIISMFKSLKQEELEGTIDLGRLNSRQHILEEKQKANELKKIQRAAKKDKA